MEKPLEELAKDISRLDGRQEAHFTPEISITIPRHSVALPNHDGTLVLYELTTNDYKTGGATTSYMVYDLITKQTHAIQWTIGSWHKAQWFGKNHILLMGHDPVNRTPKEVWVCDFDTIDRLPYKIGTLVKDPVRVLDSSLRDLDDGNVRFVFRAEPDKQGRLQNKGTSNNENYPVTSAREIENLYPHDETVWGSKRNHSIFYTIIERDNSTGRYKLSSDEPINVLMDTGLRNPEIPRQTANGIVFAAQNPRIKPLGLDEIYLCCLGEGGTGPSNVIPLSSQIKDMSGTAIPYGVSVDGWKVVFQKKPCKERYFDFGGIFIVNLKPSEKDLKIPDLRPRRIQIMEMDHPTKPVDHLVPKMIEFSHDGSEIFVSSPFRGTCCLFRVPLVWSPERDTYDATKAFKVNVKGSVLSMAPVPHTDKQKKPGLLVTTSSFVDSATYHTVFPHENTDKVFYSVTSNESRLHFKPSQFSQFTFQGSGDYTCQSFTAKPSFFRPGQKYPVVFIIHGGPHACFLADWDYGRDAAIFAEQGYIVIMPNISGSTGFGEKFERASIGEWGGRPYQDLVKCFEHVEKNFGFVDVSKAILTGASYGGYMVLWTAGQPLAKKFCALISQCGIISSSGMFAGTCLTGLAENTGRDISDPTSMAANWDRYSPLHHTSNWTQPMLIMHNSRDTICLPGESYAAYSICRMKGIPCRLVDYDGEGHGEARAENILHRWKTVLGWCNKYAGITGGIELDKPISERTDTAENEEKVKKMEESAEKLFKEMERIRSIGGGAKSIAKDRS
ncbi:alpha/beta-hydrolase [Tothia fuscella]|uniref:Dipeptidyl-peptidase V n=1 Tax=Tothia fuscella TaxID=1048955 RepID=A0A9P4NRA0_9PEZI|nr:alpha/beta-hydrolase [Tothia fuscella]